MKDSQLKVIHVIVQRVIDAEPTLRTTILSGQIIILDRESLRDRLLVLDGLEVAQHVKQHKDIWEFLELLLAQAPELRVLVSGRAPISLVLGRRPANQLPLKGLAREDADSWLLDRDVTDKVVRDQVLTVSRPVPWVLKLAPRYLPEPTY